MADRQIEIELKLAMQSLRKQLSEAKAMIQKALEEAAGGGGRGKRKEVIGAEPSAVDKGTKAIDNQTAAVEKLTRAQKKLREEGSKVEPGQKITFTENQPSAFPSPPASAAQRAIMAKPYTAAMHKARLAMQQTGRTAHLWSDKALAAGAQRAMGMGPLFNPAHILASPALQAQGARQLTRMGPLFPPVQAPPVIPPPTPINWRSLASQAGRLLPSGVGGTAVRGGMAAGQGAASMASAAGASAAAAAAIVAPIAVAVAAVGVTLMAFKKALNESLVAIERSKAVYASSLQSGGMSLGFTQRKTSLAAVIGVGEGEVLQYGAAISQLNDKMAFSIGVLSSHNATLTKTSWQLGTLKSDFSALWSSMATFASPAIRTLSAVVSGFVRSFTMMVEAFIAKQKMIVDATFWIMDNLLKLLPTGLSKYLRDFVKGVKEFFVGEAPAPVASSKRMQTSTWERMGMVVGQGGGGAAAETAKNTKESAKHLSTIVKKMSGRSTRDLGEDWGGAAMNAA